MTDGVPDLQTPAPANFQYEIFVGGSNDQIPKLPISVRDLEERAREVLSAEAFGYVAGGAGAERTMRANLQAFEHWEIVPRMLRDVSVRDLSTSVLGTAMPAPVMLAPVGVQSIVHPDAELAAGRAAAAWGVPFILSTAASHSMEAVAETMGEGSRWYQLYWPKDRDLAASFVNRAGQAGYSAIVVTLDTWMLIGHWAYQFANPSVTWEDLAWLREQSGLPIVLKGILHPEDARRAVQEGVDGLIVSNHGGRQVDGAIGALHALPVIREAVGRDLPILFDSGIRTGADVFKALALGANAVCLGRPYVWGLALDGQAGVEQVLRSLLAELDLTVALSGYTAVTQLDGSSLIDRSG